MQTKKRRACLTLVLLLMLSISLPVRAYITCTEHVAQVIVHQDGNVYFMTDQTCTSNGWCMLSWSSASAMNQAYAMMLTAVAQGVPLVFAWGNITNCNALNQLYASPLYIVMQPAS